jgi:hypothetical protein
MYFGTEVSVVLSHWRADEPLHKRSARRCGYRELDPRSQRICIDDPPRTGAFLTIRVSAGVNVGANPCCKSEGHRCTGQYRQHVGA